MEKWMKLSIGNVEIKYREDDLNGQSVIVMPTEDLLRILRQDEERRRAIWLIHKRGRLTSGSSELMDVDDALQQLGIIAYKAEGIEFVS